MILSHAVRTPSFMVLAAATTLSQALVIAGTSVLAIQSLTIWISPFRMFQAETTMFFSQLVHETTVFQAALIVVAAP